MSNDTEVQVTTTTASTTGFQHVAVSFGFCQMMFSHNGTEKMIIYLFIFTDMAPLTKKKGGTAPFVNHPSHKAVCLVVQK